MNIEQYKKRFYNLMESTMGDVKPLINEGTPEVNPDEKEYKRSLADYNLAMDYLGCLEGYGITKESQEKFPSSCKSSQYNKENCKTELLKMGETDETATDLITKIEDCREKELK